MNPHPSGKCICTGQGGDWLEPSVLPKVFHIMIHVEKYTYLFSTLMWTDNTGPGLR